MKKRLRLLAWPVAVAALAFLWLAPRLALPGDEPGLYADWWVPDRVCFRWSPPECYQRWVKLIEPTVGAAAPPETPLCRYGSPSNSPRCDYRYALPRRPQ